MGRFVFVSIVSMNNNNIHLNGFYRMKSRVITIVVEGYVFIVSKRHEENGYTYPNDMTVWSLTINRFLTVTN